ncbi:MAG: DUF2817 domain-containing protein [Giesbergeria sp.]|nr:DUF2817 domain-containing protein [Giesbergeria sp.]
MLSARTTLKSSKSKLNCLTRRVKFFGAGSVATALLLAANAPSVQASAVAAQTAAVHANACALFLPRLPGIAAPQCHAAQLVPSGAHSRQGRPLFWRDVHTPASVKTAASPAAKPLRVLVIGAIHGDELTSAALALQWIALAEAAQPSHQAVHWRFIPVLNPDGFLAKKPSRVNARGVDLNRNFHTPEWHRDAPVYWEKRTRKDPRRWPGPAPLSEPETQFLHQQMDQFGPQLVVSIHAPYGVLDFDGPHEPPQRLGKLRLDRVGVFPGSLGHYGGVQQGMPVVTIELEHALTMPRDTEVRSMWRDLLRWMDARLLQAAPQGKSQRASGSDAIHGFSAAK